MRVRFDYLQGPVLGHKRRCETFRQVLEEHGNSIVDSNPDFLIVDYPEESIPEPIDQTPRLLMGTLPRYPQDYAWHALGPHHAQTLTGREYLILDPQLLNYKDSPKTGGLLITCGGADPYLLTELLLSQEVLFDFTDVAVILGPGFGRSVNVPTSVKTFTSLNYNAMLKVMSSYHQIICAWGTTTFEAMYLGAHVIPIVLTKDHQDEAKRLKCSYVTQENAQSAFTLVKRGVGHLPAHHLSVDYGIDLDGASRLCLWLEAIHYCQQKRKKIS